MIDLHMHTTASDGRSSPAELVDRVRAVGITTFSVTDHDTMAAVPEAARLAAESGLEFVPGIEITTVAAGKDVHVLGYFLDPGADGLDEFLAGQRQERLERAHEIAGRLARLGVPIDVDALVRAAPLGAGRAIARPQIAHALLAAGHVDSVQEAFDRFLHDEGPAYVPHRGAAPDQAVALVARSGGIASLAHPGPLKRDGLIPGLVDAGLGAIEAYHSDHDAEATSRYLELAKRLGLAVTGGSDYHGEGTRRASFFGTIDLPADEFRAFVARRKR